ncbi:MAG: PEGA domain-containing protein [Planctomycetes bacterium]|nr:PEGA domain-containing protein [Planctomycetota bacterium]
MKLSARTAIVVLIGLTLLPASGCVRRRLNVRSNPPGALVYVDNQQIGTTPCSVDFTYYGTREIRLIKPGYETLTVNQPIPTPWYQIPPLDFVSENLAPTKIRDNRTVTYDLAPQIIVPTEQLLDRANQLRQETLQFPVAPAAVSGPVGGLPVVTPAFAPAPASPPPVSAPIGPVGP